MKNVAAIILSLLSVTAMAQQVGDFSLTNVMDGKPVALKDFYSSPGIVIIFTMNNCPFDDYYSGRIKILSAGKVPVLLVNSHPDPSESAESMVTFANQRGLSLPYLADKDQILMQSLDAHKSTEVFLLKNDHGKFSVYFHGAIDDNPQMATDVKHPYLQEAINKMLRGEANEGIEIRPVGCNLRKK